MTRLPRDSYWEDKPGPITGIRGWLLLYVASACFAPGHFVSGFANTVGIIKVAWGHSLAWTLGMVASLLVQGGVAVGSVYGLYLIFTQARATREFHVALWQAASVASLVCAACLTLGSSAMAGRIPLVIEGAEVAAGMPPFVFVLPQFVIATIAAIWWQYWKKSVRVLNTFPDEHP